MPPTIYRALPAALQAAREPRAVPDAGVYLGMVWSQPIADDHPVLLIADTPEIRQKLASVGILVQERPVKEAAA